MISLEFIKKINIRKFAKQSLEFFYWKVSWLLLFLFMILSLYCVYIWYEFVHNPHWDEQRKEEYIKNKGVGVNFDKNGFNHLVDEQKKRRVNYSQKIEGINDIFRLER